MGKVLPFTKGAGADSNQGNAEGVEGKGEKPEALIVETSLKASKLLEKVVKEDAQTQRHLEFLGLKNNDKAIENLRTAMQMARKHFDLDEDRIFVKRLEGQAVGKAENGNIYLDPWTVLDSIRCFAVLMHERAHIGKKGKIQNEAVTEAYVRAIAPIAENSDIQEPPKYTDWMANYYKVLDRLGDRTKMAKWVWEICSEKTYPKLWAEVKKIIAEAKTKEEKDLIFREFELAFPELSYTDGEPDFGRAKVVPMKKKAKPGKPEEETGDQQFSLAA